MNNNMHNVKLLIKGIFVISMLTSIFLWVDLNATIEYIEKMSILPYVFVVFGHFILMAIKSYRWKLICSHAKINIPYQVSLLSYIVSFAFSTFTPGQVGDVSKIYFVRKYSENSKKVLGTIIVDRIWDLILLAVFTSIAVACVFSDLFYNYWHILIILPFGIYIVLFKMTFFKKNLIKYPWVLFDYKKIFIISFFSATVQLSRWILLAYAFNIQLIISSMIATIGNFIALIPISVSGLGSRDLVMAYLFDLNSMPPSAGVAFSMMMFNTNVIGALVGIVLFVLIKK